MLGLLKTSTSFTSKALTMNMCTCRRSGSVGAVLELMHARNASYSICSSWACSCQPTIPQITYAHAHSAVKHNQKLPGSLQANTSTAASSKCIAANLKWQVLHGCARLKLASISIQTCCRWQSHCQCGMVKSIYKVSAYLPGSV